MNGSLFVKEIEPTSLKIKKDLSTLAKILQTVTSKTIYVKSVRRLEELCGESKMKPFYVCEICTSSYQEDLRNNKDGHYVALSNEHPQPRKCKGTLQPAFFYGDIEKLIKARIEQWQNEIDLMEGKPENEYPTSFCKHRITENKAILDALNSPKDGAEGSKV